MEDPQPQNADIIVETNTFTMANNDVIGSALTQVDIKAVDISESYSEKIDHIINKEASGPLVQDQNDSALVVESKVQNEVRVEQVEQQSSNSDKAENDQIHTVVDTSKDEESDKNDKVVEESVPVELQQTEQSQSSEPESNNLEQNPDRSQDLVILTKIIHADQPNKIKEVAEEAETEETKGTEVEVQTSWRKERSPKLNHLRIKTQAKHIEESNDNTNTTITEIKLPNGEAEDQEATTGQSEEQPKTFGSPSIRKVQSQSEMAVIMEPSTNAEKVMKPVPLKRICSQNDGLGKEKDVDPEQPQSAATPSRSRVSMEDFQKVTSVGRGSYGEVFLVKKISTNKLYALKSIDKNFMKKERKEHQVYVEREVLLKLNHPNIIKLYSSFQDKNKLYFVLEYASGGEFSDYLRVQGKLSKEQIVFFTAEIINILEYIHSSGIAHRDLKPENILLTQEGHLKCIDFGTARYLTTDKRTAELYDIKNKAEETLDGPPQVKKNHRTTFVGTAQYVSPEMLDGADTGAPADLWALGCIIYLMATGQFAFVDMNEYLIFQKIKAVTVKYPDNMDPEIKDLVQRLLVKDPEMRLGAGSKSSNNDYEALKSHSLFRDIRFSDLHEQAAPIVEIASPHKRKSYDLDPVSAGSNTPSSNRKHFHSDDLSRTESRNTNTVDYTTDKGARIIISGLVLKKCGWWFFRPRQLILNSKAKLVYYDPDSNQLRGEIFLAPTTKAELDSKTKFTVSTPTRKFIFKEMEHSAEKWVEIINSTIAQRYPKRTEN